MYASVTHTRSRWQVQRQTYAFGYEPNINTTTSTNTITTTNTNTSTITNTKTNTILKTNMKTKANVFGSSPSPTTDTSIDTPSTSTDADTDLDTDVDTDLGTDRKYKTHIYTVASDNTTQLQNLQFTAALAGVELTVLGLGLKYEGWLQKLEWYFEALISPTTTATATTYDNAHRLIHDDDILVLIDAYDVLLTPMVRQLPWHLSKFSTPIVMCAENGGR